MKQSCTTAENVILILLIAWTNPLKAQSQGQIYAAAPKERGAYHASGVSGEYNYGYNTGGENGIAKVEVKRNDGSVVGSYRYFDPNGKQVIRSYIADHNGFRILGNDLPPAPDIPPIAVANVPAFSATSEGDGPRLQPPLSWIQASEPVEPQYQRYQQPNEQQQSSSHPVFQRTIPTTQGSSNTLQQQPSSNPALLSSFYYHYPELHNFDFPAGFAYQNQNQQYSHRQPEPVNVPSDPISVTGAHEDAAIFRMRSELDQRPDPVYPLRGESPRHYDEPIRPIYLHREQTVHPQSNIVSGHRQSRRQQSYQPVRNRPTGRPYVLGHSKK